MLTDKEAKKKYISEFYSHPDKYYATEYLKNEGFGRGICCNCNKPFWSVKERNVCGDPACGTIPFDFIGNTPAKRALDYIEVWKQFSKMFKKFGYTPIRRYPIVARWNPTMEYTNASIAAFQPYVISGEVEPPAKKLVIPQLCFRTVDIDNVGITGSHNTVFCMIGQHMFVPPKEWDQNLVFGHIHTWLKKGLGLPNEEITFHEDAWAGGGNLGPCMEYFSRGNELGNQVYMMYEQTEGGIKGLDLKVLDMGMGQERNAWFSQGVNTQYDATFPTVIKHLLKITGLSFDKALAKRYVPYSGLLNLDEVDDINKAWKNVAEKVGCDSESLKKNILPLAGIYSIAEHSRALLIMFNDGALPSNMGDSYNLRIILRRMLGFADKYGWDIDVHKLFELHAKYLKPQYPELSENLDDVREIFDVEKDKYQKTKVKSKNIITKIASRDITTKDLLELYDSQGISPDLIAQEAKTYGKNIMVPDNFYALVSGLHEEREQKHATKKSVELNFGTLENTQALYFDDHTKSENLARVVKVNGNYVVLDRTVAYPTSGGQLHDTGSINGIDFIDVFKYGNLIVHQMKSPPNFKEGQEVRVKIDIKRRLQLAQHHTATHIINEAARRVLGNHVNQASAFKGIDKAHLDITHYASISDKELDKIESLSNEFVKKSIKVKKNFLKRNVAEAKYGVRIYQGGAVPGRELRIVNIEGLDVEACGGTHLDSTKDVGRVKIISAERIQDNISRITFVAGEALNMYEEKQKNIMGEIEKILGVKGAGAIDATKKVFEEWKKKRKLLGLYKNKKSEIVISDLEKKIMNNLLVEKLENSNMDQLQYISKNISSPDRTIILFGVSDKIYVFISAGENTNSNAGELMKKICAELSGKGGGSKNLAQGICMGKNNLDEFIQKFRKEII
ncbi:MAG TPA: alanine--tRNA ligase [Candidatus Aenigmarchaeota archaeon]|nr:alanine--tRNA ligase [Candidatus Aenigmarchaeota archaeon]